MPSIQVRIDEPIVNLLTKHNPDQEIRANIEHTVECFVAISNSATALLRGVFSKKELTGIIQSLNGTLFEPKFAIIKEAFIAHLEDSERYEKISLNFSFDFSDLLAKVKSQNQFLLFFLQEDINNYWQNKASKEGSLDSFIKKYL